MELIEAWNGKPIRLTEERLAHITEQHPELLNCHQDIRNAISNPDRVLKGNEGELLAVRRMEQTKDIVVVFRELEADGFVITAFLTRRRRALDKRQQVWP